MNAKCWKFKRKKKEKKRKKEELTAYSGDEGEGKECMLNDLGGRKRICEWICRLLFGRESVLLLIFHALYNVC